MKQANTADGAQNLFSMITGQGETGQLLQAATGLLGGNDGGGLGQLLNLGKTLLPGVLGDSVGKVSEHIASSSGNAGSLLAMGLPLVLSFMRQRVQQDNLSSNQFVAGLAKQQGWLSGLLDTKMLAALGLPSLGALFTGLGAAGAQVKDEAVAGVKKLEQDLKAAAPTVASGGLPGWLKIAGLTALALIAFSLFKSCSSKPETTVMPAASAPEMAAAPALG